MPSIRYQHTQIGFVILGIVAFATGGLVVLWGTTLMPISVGLPVIALLAAAASLFYALTVEVYDDMIRWYFGFGFWTKSIPLKHIRRVESVGYPWYYGYGIRYTPEGWLYNVSGTRAVKLFLIDGTMLLLGTDDPEELARTLRQHANI